MKIVKLIKWASITVFSLATIAAISISLYCLFVYNKINFEADERLFESALTFNSTTFYADKKTSEEYNPVQIEMSGAIRKMHYSLEEISPYIKEGFVAVEDKIFYEHPGVDFKRTVLAVANYFLKRDKVFGASTITQQVVKNISGDNQKKISRKLAEILRAFHIEENYTKEEILEVYLNVIPMSENIYGVGAASRAYFGKEPTQLSIAEAATLIGITNAPSAYNPYKNCETCKQKRNIVLSVMYNDGIINNDEYIKAKNEPLSVIPRESREDRFDSWFVETVIEEGSCDLAKKFNISFSAARIMLLGGGFDVYTTMDIRVQEILNEYFENAENFPSEIGEGLNYAMTITDSISGDLVAVMGSVGKKNGDRLLNHATTPHIPGSVIKPIALYAPLLDEGKINWSTVFDDVPVSFRETDDGYREYPRNSPTVYDGLTTVKDALRYSKNTVAVRLCNLMGTNNVFNNLKKNFGFDTLVENEGGLTDIAVSPMALGQLSRGVSLLKLTEGYSIFPSDGISKNARSYLKIVDHKGETVIDNKKIENRIIKESTARIMNQMLMTVTEDGTAGSLEIKKYVQVAGKTGTSGNNRDKLFIGYTPYYVAGIWCGYNSGDKSVVGLSKGHLAVWDEIMSEIHNDIEIDNQREFSTEGLLHLPYCMDSGEQYTETCMYDPRGNRMELGYFTEDNKPHSKCSRHIMCFYDSVTKCIACPSCPKENLVGVALISVSDRSFPKEIEVTDAEFVYRDTSGYIRVPDDCNLPYFYYSIPTGEYVGVSGRKKQFNCGCHIHRG